MAAGAARGSDDVVALIKSRRSVRRFDAGAGPVPDEVVDELLEAMRWAPSAGNAQPWRAHVVRDGELRRRLAAAALGQSFVAEAPVAIVVAVELREARDAYGARGEELYCLQDAAAAIQNLLLAAHARGLGSCWIGAFRERSVAEALGLPGTQRPVAIVPLGPPAEAPTPPARRPLEELVSRR
jgi:nitroreductase